MKNSVRKDKSIQRLLERLKSIMGDNAFDVVDHWEADLFSIGIAKPDNHGVLVYVSTYRQEVESYEVVLEYLTKPGSDLPYDQGDDSRVQGIDELVKVIQSHLARS